MILCHNMLLHTNKEMLLHNMLLHTNKEINFNITHVRYLYDINCPRSTIPTRGSACSSVPFWSFLMSIHGVAFTMTDGIMYFISFSQSHQNHTYHYCNPSPYHPSRCRTVSSSVSPSGYFAWSRLVHSPARHTTVTVTGQVKAQIWAHIS
jgi:hypothetical protein